MSKIVSDLIRSKIKADAIDEVAADNLVALIHDSLPADAGLDTVDHAVQLARDAYSPLFRKPAPKAEVQRAPVRPQPSTRPQATDLYGQPRRSADEIAGNRVRVGTAAGNPWAAGLWNVTRQAMVQAADPALAARLRSEAGR